jgi:hypothetical protein
VPGRVRFAGYWDIVLTYKVLACRYKVDFSEMTSIDDDEDEFYGSDDDSGESRISWASVPNDLADPYPLPNPSDM